MSWTTIASLSMLGMWAVGYLIARMSKNGNPATSEKSEPAKVGSDEADNKKEVVSPTLTSSKGVGGSGFGFLKGLAFIALTLLAVWGYGEVTRPDSLGSGATLWGGHQVTVSKHQGPDYSDLPKYDVMANGITRLETNGKDVYIIKWKRNGEQYVPATQGPELYDGEFFCRDAVETFSLFLDPKSSTRKVKVNVQIDDTRKCKSTGGFVVVN